MDSPASRPRGSVTRHPTVLDHMIVSLRGYIPTCFLALKCRRTIGRVGTVDPCGYGVSPSPNRACTFPRTRLSILEGVLEAVLFKRTAFACPTFPAWDSRTVSLPLSVQLSIVLPPPILSLIHIILAAKPITGKRWVLWRLRYPTGDWTKPAHQLRQSCVSA